MIFAIICNVYVLYFVPHGHLTMYILHNYTIVHIYTANIMMPINTGKLIIEEYENINKRLDS